MLTPRLEDIWSDVDSRLAAMLRRRGVAPHDVEEVVQETATRVITSGVTYSSGDDLFRWAAVVGWRLALDRKRAERRLTGEPVPERRAADDVGRIVENRVVLAEVGRQMGLLSEKDRQALLSSVGDNGGLTRQESVRQSVARHRARNRLRALLQGLVAVLPWVWAHRRVARPGRWQLAAVSLPLIGAALMSPLVHTQESNNPPAAVVTTSLPTVSETRRLEAPAVAAPVHPARPAATTRARTVPRGGNNGPASVLSPAPTLPGVDAIVPTPRGDTGGRLRPGQDGEPMLCVKVRREVMECVDSPLPPLKRR